jgi:hypothetical protein
MSPVLANTLNVRASPPVRLRDGQMAYIKTDLCKRVCGLREAWRGGGWVSVGAAADIGD